MVKNNNEKVFELKIEEDDDLSGIDSISLVDEPAIEVNWIAFRKETEHSFEQDDVYVKHLMDKGETEEDLLNDGWVIESMEILDGKDSFISTSTNPNAPSFEDEKEYKVRYKYILNPDISGPAIIPTSRHFCRQLIAQNRVWRVEDIESAVNDFGDSPLVYRGSFNCRHVWSRMLYKKDATIINKASVNTGKLDVNGFPSGLEPDVRVLGYTEPSTVTKRTAANPSPSTVRNLGLSKENFEKVSLDYDGVLSTDKGKELAKKLISQNKDLYIITRRQESDLGPVLAVAKALGIARDKVHATNGKLKWETIKKLGIKRHIDNSADELDALAKNLPDVGERFDYAVGTIGGYVDPGLKKKPIPKSVNTEKEFINQFEYLFASDTIKCENCGWQWNMEDTDKDPYVCHKCSHDNSSYYQSNFESHSDYPESVKNNAKAVLKYVEENGWGSCGTDVGKQRANQLAKGEPISEDTIRRMYSYLSRHEKDLDSSKGYGDGCGKLMYDSWGGKTALNWAKSKINTFDKQKMSKQKFATDEEKRIVLGPAMIPDQKIFRKDELGNPYYVFFSPETIKMIADKYMKNKYTDNNDQMHDGEAVKDVYVVETWIKEDMEYDKGNAYGFNDLPVGTWFVSMKVNNPEIWSKVKEGQLRGFSVSGFFEEVATFCREEMFLKQLVDLLKNIKD